MDPRFGASSSPRETWKRPCAKEYLAIERQRRNSKSFSRIATRWGGARLCCRSLRYSGVQTFEDEGSSFEARRLRRPRFCVSYIYADEGDWSSQGLERRMVGERRAFCVSLTLWLRWTPVQQRDRIWTSSTDLTKRSSPGARTPRCGGRWFSGTAGRGLRPTSA